jgi:LysR family glycine cleavage system transcriptional activator
MAPDLISLGCFVAAGTHLNFRTAARLCALSPAAFGQRIRLLEEQVGATLLERTTRRVRLSPAGERLLPHARALLEGAEQCARVAQEDRVHPFELTLGTRFELGLSWIVPALDELEAKNPARRIHLFFGDSDLLARVQRGELDAAVTSARIAHPQLRVAALCEERYAFVGGKRMLKKQPLCGARDADTHTLIDVHPDLPLFRYLLDASRAGEAFRFRRTEHMGTIAAVRARVLAGAGVAVLPEYFVREDLARGRLVRILPRTRLPTDWFRLVWRAGHPRETQLQALAAELAVLPLR